MGARFNEAFQGFAGNHVGTENQMVSAVAAHAMAVPIPVPITRDKLLPKALSKTPSALARDTLALLLCGGRGTRLGPLTDWRAKPAVPFGSRFRIVDFTLANCVNSGIRRIGVLTQYKAQSLIRHIEEGWSLNRRFGEFVDVIPAQQRLGKS